MSRDQSFARLRAVLRLVLHHHGAGLPPRIDGRVVDVPSTLQELQADAQHHGLDQSGTRQELP